MRIAILTIAGGTLGYGHVFRMLGLKRTILARNWECLVCVGATDKFEKAIEAVDTTVDLDVFFEEQYLQSMAMLKEADIVLLDLSHPYILTRARELEENLLPIATGGTPCVFVDSPGEAAIIRKLRRPDLFNFLYPYANKMQNLPRNTAVFQGPHLAMLDERFSGIPAPQIRKVAHRVLVTLGGADPFKLTLHVLQALEEIRESLEVRIIIGPLFARDLKDSINSKVEKSHHTIEQIQTPESLMPEFQWCDVTVSASGLTKYELAASGIPAILLSIDPLHNELNQSFMALGSALDMGLSRDPQLLALRIKTLLADFDQRLELSRAGQSVIDGQGNARILDILDGLSNHEFN